MLTNRFSPSTEAIRFQTLHHGQDKIAVQGCQGQDCRPTQGWNGLQDHRQAAWWEGDNNWCDYSQMEEIQYNGQSPSVWSSMQDFTSWSFNDKNGEKSATAATIVTKKTIDNTLRMKDWNPAAPTRSPCSRKHMYGPSEACQWFRGELGESVVVDETKIQLFGINSTRRVEEKECCLWPQEHHPLCQTWRWKHYTLGGSAKGTG